MNDRIHELTAGWLFIVLCLTQTAVATADSTLVKTTVAYRVVDRHEILADVYRPAGDEVCPVIVWIHGGALIVGHRESISSQVRQLAEEQRCALVSIDYRLAPETILPALISDIEAAFRWLGDDGASQFHLDPNRIVVAGASAGGYLTLVTGYRVQPKPKALVSLFGYGDLTGDWYSTPSPHARHNARKVTRATALAQTDGSVISDDRQRMGNGMLIYLHYRQNGIWPEEVSGFERATIRKQIAPFEPIHNVSADYPTTLLIHGTEDTDVPFEQSELMAKQFARHHVPFVFKSIENGEHGLNGGNPEQISDAWQTMREFIAEKLEPAE